MAPENTQSPPVPAEELEPASPVARPAFRGSGNAAATSQQEAHPAASCVRCLRPARALGMCAQVTLDNARRCRSSPSTSERCGAGSTCVRAPPRHEVHANRICAGPTLRAAASAKGGSSVLEPQSLDKPEDASERSADASEPPLHRRYGEGKPAIVVGAGPGGLLAALLLAQRGFTVDVFEKRSPPDVKANNQSEGSRSIVFGLLTRGQDALRKGGIRLPKRGHGPSWMNGLAVSRGIHQNTFADGHLKSTYMPMMPNSDVLFVERQALVEHMVLELRRLQPDRLRILYDHHISDIDFEARRVQFTDGAGASGQAEFELLLGCDGRNSFVRGALEAFDPEMRHEEHVSDRSYKGFYALPPAAGSDDDNEEGISMTFHITTERVLKFASAHWPTRNGTVTGQISGPRTFFEENPNTPEMYAAHIREQLPAFPKEWIPEVSQQLVRARASPSGASIKCSKLHGPRVVLFGDAAHGVTPAMGQGCNAALESARIFAEVLDDCDGNLDTAPERFTRARLKDAQALYTLDRTYRDRSGYNGPTFWSYAAGFHALLGKALSKALPFWFRGPANGTLMQRSWSYSHVLYALRRDAALFAILIAAGFGAAILGLQSAIPVLAKISGQE